MTIGRLNSYKSSIFENSDVLYIDYELNIHNSKENRVCYRFEGIEYSDEVPDKINMIDSNSNSGHMRRSLLTKSLDWKYESECRLLSTKHTHLVDDDTKLTIEKDHLSGIIFGLNAEKKDMLSVYEIVDEHYIQKGIPVNFYKASRVLKKYAIEIKLIDDINNFLNS